jgi:tRNA dimethylallyltransferase
MLKSGQTQSPVLVLVGPTAIGKTELSLRMGQMFDCEIVSVDSMQVYRHMDIGTAKATPEERARLPHHLIDIVDPDETYDAVKFARDAARAISQIHARGKTPLLTGGTGLYLKAVLYGIFPGVPESKEIRNELYKRIDSEGIYKLHEELSKYDPASADRIHKNDAQRVVRALEVFLLTGKTMSAHLAEHRGREVKSPFANTLQLGLTTERELLYSRINQRCTSMVDSGLEDEVHRLLAMGYSTELNAMKSIGYRHMVNYITGAWSEDRMHELLARDTRRYAKRQYTWFSSIPELTWFDITDQDDALRFVSDWLDNQQQATQ